MFHFLQDNTGLHWPHLVGHRNICSWVTSKLEVTTNSNHPNNRHIPYATFFLMEMVPSSFVLVCTCVFF